MRPVSPRSFRLACSFVLVAGSAVLAGCGGGAVDTGTSAAPPAGAPTPAPPTPTPPPAAAAGQLASGWRYRFDMVSPANDNFAVTSREVYLYFKPDTTAVSFQVENRLGVPINILWDESTFIDVYGRTSKAVHRGVTYDNRDLPQEAKILQPGERYSDFLIPVDLLNDPGAASGQGARALLPTDLSAQSLVGRIFGPTLVMTGETGERITYDVRFRVVSVYSDR